jgi:hypothetical protein
LLVFIHLKLICELAVSEMLFEAYEEVALDHGVFVSTLGVTFDVAESLFYGLRVCEDKFEVNHLDIAPGVDPSGYVVNIIIFKNTHDLADHVGLTDIREELVAEALPTGCPLYETGDIDELNDGGNDVL